MTTYYYTSLAVSLPVDVKIKTEILGKWIISVNLNLDLIFGNYFPRCARMNNSTLRSLRLFRKLAKYIKQDIRYQ